MANNISIGNPEAQKKFAEENPAFVEEIPNLGVLIETALNASRQDSLNDKLVVELSALAFKAQEIHAAYPGEYLTQERFDEIKAQRDAVKDNYIVKCDKCGKPRVNHAWSKTNIIQMAKNRGFEVYQIMGSYYAGIDETYPKMAAIFERVQVREGEAEPDNGRGTLALAHGYALWITSVLKERSDIKEIEEMYSERLKRFTDIWCK